MVQFEVHRLIIDTVLTLKLTGLINSKAVWLAIFFFYGLYIKVGLAIYSRLYSLVRNLLKRSVKIELATK